MGSTIGTGSTSQRESIVDLLGAIGLTLPALFRTKPLLAALVASGIVVLMGCAGLFYIVRGEASLIGVNIFVAARAAFIAWGRFRKVPIPAK